MGVTGFAFENNSVNFVDHYDQIKQHNSKTQPTSVCFALGNDILGEAAFKILNRRLCENNPFCSKIDNFLNKEKLCNVVFSSLQDEAEFGEPLSVGVMQLYNKTSVTSEDLTYIHHIRKLVGAALAKSDLIKMVLFTILGVNDDAQTATRTDLLKVNTGQQNGLKISNILIEKVSREVSEGSCAAL